MNHGCPRCPVLSIDLTASYWAVLGPFYRRSSPNPSQQHEIGPLSFESYSDTLRFLARPRSSILAARLNPNRKEPVYRFVASEKLGFMFRKVRLHARLNDGVECSQIILKTAIIKNPALQFGPGIAQIFVSGQACDDFVRPSGRGVGY